MDQPITDLEENVPEKQSGCTNCGHPVLSEGATSLCSECRESFIKFPIPVLIKAFGGIVLLILIFAMTKFPKSLSAGVHYERGNDAMDNHNYYTAQREFEKVIKEIPDYSEAKQHLAIASFHNLDMNVFIPVANELVGKAIEDQGTYFELQKIIDKAGDYFPSDSFSLLMENYPSIDSIPEQDYRDYISKYPEEVFPISRFASVLLNQNRYTECDSVLNGLLIYDGNFVNALTLKTSLKRQIGQMDSSHYYCDKLLSLNQEFSYGIASKARTYLMEKKNKEGLQWAQKSVAIDKKDFYSLATLAMAYHFNNKTAERDKLIKEVEADSVGVTYIGFVKDVISGKEKFQNR